jgi:hypothetical protein
VTRYVLGDFDLEFITPLRGSENKRGKPDATVLVAGVTAQKLRHVDVLEQSPWAVDLREEHGYPVGPTPIRVRVPNPASFIAQKLLTLPYRNGFNKRVKDVLYVHDTVEQFRDALAELRDAWRDVRPTLHRSVVSKLRQQCEVVFAPSSIYLIPAAGVARSTGRPDPPSHATLAAVCRVALREIFELP